MFINLILKIQSSFWAIISSNFSSVSFLAFCLCFHSSPFFYFLNICNPQHIHRGTRNATFLWFYPFLFLWVNFLTISFLSLVSFKISLDRNTLADIKIHRSYRLPMQHLLCLRFEKYCSFFRAGFEIGFGWNLSFEIGYCICSFLI